MAWKAGVAVMDITPPIGVWLTGYAARTHPCVGIHDPLSTRALVLENGDGQRAALLTLDLIALTYKQVAQLRRLVREWTGIPPQNLLINCSHTHSAPAVGELAASCMGIPNASYLDVTICKAATTVKLAAESLQQARLRFGVAECRIGINRRQRTTNGRIVLGQNPEGTIDPHTYVLIVETPDGTPIAITFSYACHAVVMGDDNYFVSADYPGYARKAVERFFDGATALFLQGCAGNINPRERGTFSIAEKLGNELAASVIQAALKAEPVEDETVEGVGQNLKLPLLPPPPPKWLRQWRRDHLTHAKAAKQEGRHGEVRWRHREAEWAANLFKAMKENSLPTDEQIEAQVLLVGDVAFAGQASETFVEIGLAVQQQSPLPRTVPLGYTNGCVGYMPTASSYEEGGYEVEQAFKFYGRLLMHSPDSESIVTNWLIRQLHRLSKTPHSSLAT